MQTTHHLITRQSQSHGAEMKVKFIFGKKLALQSLAELREEECLLKNKCGVIVFKGNALINNYN